MKHSFKPGVILLLLALAVFLLNSCRDDIEVYKIKRLGVLSFSTDSLNTQYAAKVNFLKGIKTLYYYSPDNQVMYTRYLMEATGVNPESGKDFILNIEFDLTVDGSYIGIFRPQYDIAMGGIHKINYIENNVSYNMDTAYLSENYFRVERQNQEEKLVLGDFFAKLINDRPPYDKIVFYQGTFKDITYARF
jgi:hypothetical protein